VWRVNVKLSSCLATVVGGASWQIQVMDCGCLKGSRDCPQALIYNHTCAADPSIMMGIFKAIIYIGLFIEVTRRSWGVSGFVLMHHVEESGVRSKCMTVCHAANECDRFRNLMDRRTCIQTTCLTAPFLQASTSGAEVQTTSLATTAETAEITHKVYLNTRIARSDGSFYIREVGADEDPDDTVFYGRITIGLFGKDAPNHVDRFLSYVDGEPSYARSIVSAYDDTTGVLTAGRIPSLTLTNFKGTSMLEYQSQLRPAPLWIDTSPRISHQARGLLSHANFDPTPTFHITTRADSSNDLDATHTPFGRILWDASSSEFISRVTQLPVYRLTAQTDNVAAATVFNAQRQFFRNTAQSMGDSRLKTYPGKLLRKVEIVEVGMT